ncbi:amidase [Kitasatospora sp. CMC57]|uniref:Amidase n=1 Tax=Kitasatospora sp. CMC57 TaxID=3231513 RepID=A0AB33JPF8_9ACTN
MTDTGHPETGHRDRSTSTFPELPELQRQLRDGRLTSVSLTRRCLDRIELVDPLVGAVLAVDDSALEQAARSDRRYAAGAERGPLDGIPVLVKDNIDTAGLGGTAGSRLLTANPPRRDAGIVRRLRAAGAVVLGKTNLSEWSNFRSTQATEGWSGAGGQTRNPYRLDRSPGGSSAGSAVAVATGMAPLALGTETDGSIVGPAGLCGVVGVKPETGLLPLDGIVPISPVQDTVGVLAARLGDAALAMAALTGRPPAEPDPAMLRVGLWRVPRMPGAVDAVLDAAVQALRAAGVAVVPVDLALDRQTVEDGLLAMYAEFRPGLETYLRGRPGGPQTLAELIEGNRADPVELSLFDQDLFEQAQLIGEAEREKAGPARHSSREQARTLLDRTMRRYGVQAVLAATNEPAPVIDYELGDPGTPGSSTPAALAGYPNISLPVGHFRELPIGLSVFGPPTLERLLPVALRLAEACAVRRTPALR